MKFFTVAALAGAAMAHGPQGKVKRAMGDLFKEIIETGAQHLAKRQQPVPGPLIGNLVPAGTGGSAVNDRIVNCFNSQNGVGCTDETGYTPPAKDTPACAKDTCCIWSYIGAELAQHFKEADGTCNDLARNCVRFGFHDAGAWNQDSTFGGADGSILLNPSEVQQPVNFGLEKARNFLGPMYNTYKSYGISAADFVQFAHNVAVVTCPLGPRELTLIGRPDSSEFNNVALLPDARASAASLIQLFNEKTITVVDLVALLGAHTSAKQFFFDVAQANKPFDSTPGVWDVAFYSEVLNGTDNCGVFRLPSDAALGVDPSAVFGFNNFAQGFPADQGLGQITWNGLYSRGYTRLSLLGVKDIQGMTDCTKALPHGVATFAKPASAIVKCPADGGNGGNGGNGNGGGYDGGSGSGQNPGSKPPVPPPSSTPAAGNGGGYGDDGSIKSPTTSSACKSKSTTKVYVTSTAYAYARL